MPEPIASARPPNARPRTFTITELADEFALTTRAIRFTKIRACSRRSGAAPGASTRRANGCRLKLILRGKRLGMSLADIAEILDLYDVGDVNDPAAQIPRSAGARAVRCSEQQREDIDVVLEEISAIEARLPQTVEEFRPIVYVGYVTAASAGPR